MSKEKKFKAPKEKPIKEFGGGDYTKSAFFQMIRSALRQRSRFWTPIQHCKKLGRRDYNGPNKRQKYEYLCAVCGNYFSDKEISIDHIKPVGKLNDYEDLPDFVRNLFCEVDNLQIICKKDHDEKTKLERSSKVKE